MGNSALAETITETMLETVLYNTGTKCSLRKKKKRVPVLPTTLFFNHWLPPHLNSIQFGCERGKCPVEITLF